MRLPQRPATGSQPMQSYGRRGDRMMNRRAAAAQKRRPNRSRPKACSRRGSYGRKLARLAGRLGCLAMSSYVARPHVLADQFVPGYLGDSFGLFPFVHGDPLANQFDGPFLIRLIGEEVTHTSGFPLGIESRDPDIPSCWHSGTMRPSCCWSIPCHNQADPLSGNDTPTSSGNNTPKRVGRTERAGCRTASCSA